MFTMVLTIHILVAISLIVLILIQHGKGADAGAAFGSGAAGSVFGARGANSFLYKLTSILAATFFATSLILTYLAGNEISDGSKGIVEQTTIISDLPDDLPQGPNPTKN